MKMTRKAMRHFLIDHELRGSWKQRKWGNDIRKWIVQELMNGCPKQRYEQLLTLLREKLDAKWWIENRNCLP